MVIQPSLFHGAQPQYIIYIHIYREQNSKTFSKILVNFCKEYSRQFLNCQTFYSTEYYKHRPKMHPNFISRHPQFLHHIIQVRLESLVVICSTILLLLPSLNCVIPSSPKYSAAKQFSMYARTKGPIRLCHSPFPARAFLHAWTPLYHESALLLYLNYYYLWDDRSPGAHTSSLVLCASSYCTHKTATASTDHFGQDYCIESYFISFCLWILARNFSFWFSSATLHNLLWGFHIRREQSCIMYSTPRHLQRRCWRCIKLSSLFTST